MWTLKGKTILLTGASRGIGAAATKALSDSGARVLAHASGPSDAMTTSASAAKLGDEDVLFEDLSQPGAGARLVAAALERTERLDGIINNAGVDQPTPLSGPVDAWTDGWSKILAVNVQAPADICRAAIAHYRAHDGGRIINMASRAAYRGDGMEHSAYGASKGAINAMTKTFARALSGEGIYVYGIAPGWVDTEMAPQDEAGRAAAIAEVPMGQLAQPEEVAALMVFLLSDACASATGSTFDVNGASYVR